MKIQLSYTVDEENIFGELAKLIGLKAEAMQRMIDLYTQVQAELTPDEDKPVNVTKVEGMISDFRAALVDVDARLREVGDIIGAYESHRRSDGPTLVEPSLVEPSLESQ